MYGRRTAVLLCAIRVPSVLVQLVARVEAQLRQRDGWIMAEMEAARSNDLLDQVAEAPIAANKAVVIRACGR